MNKKTIFFCFPLSGPNNGVKVISTHILKSLSMDKRFSLQTIDTAQAKGFNNFGNLNFNKILQTIPLLKKLWQVNNQDIVYLNLTPSGFAFYRDLMMIVICKIKKGNITIHVHANGLEHKLNIITNYILKNIKIISINQSQFNKINQYHKNTFIVENALPDYYQNNFILPNNGEKIRLLFFSNLSKKKGLDRLIALIKLLANKDLYYEINICGGILSKKDENIFIDLKKKYNYINYFGPITDDRIKFGFLSNSDFLLMLSDPGYEVSPLVYIEALMSGLPIFTTPQEVSKKIVASGCAFEINDTFDNLIEITSRFHQNKTALMDLKHYCRAKYYSNYSFEDFIAQISNILLK